MDPSFYNQIIAEYEELRKTNLIIDMRFILKSLVNKFCNEENSQMVNEEVIRSIISYKYQLEQKDINRLINWKLVFDDYQKGFGLLSIAANAGISPALLSQRIIAHLCSSSVPQNQVKENQFNSNTIDNYRLAYESMLAHYSDSYYGIHYTQVSNNSGQVFEQTVEDYLKKAGVDFMNEDELRKKKYDVTPDFKLNIPIVLERHWTINENNFENKKKKCIKNYLISKPIEFIPLKSNLQTVASPLLTIEDKNITREVINWIECKSLFANEQCHKEYVQNQYNSYVNRFGKGIIIYNYGCVNTILDEDAKFIVLTQLPELLE